MVGARSGPRSRLTLADTRLVTQIAVAIVCIPFGSSSCGADAPSQRMCLLGGVAEATSQRMCLLGGVADAPSQKMCLLGGVARLILSGVSRVMVTLLEHGALDPLHTILGMTTRTQLAACGKASRAYHITELPRRDMKTGSALYGPRFPTPPIGNKTTIGPARFNLRS